MTLTQMKYVVSVDDHQHFSRAATHCGVTQPTLSAQVRKLEEELGVELFDRNVSPVRATEAGRRVIRQARLVLGEVERLHELVHSDEEVAGEFHVGVLPTVAPCFLTRFTAELTGRYPALRLRVEEQRTEDIAEGLEKGRLDAGLLATSTDNLALRERPLLREPFVAYLAPDHRLWEAKSVHPDQLRRGDLWLLREGHCFREQVLELCADMGWEGAQPPALRYESGNLETLQQLVEVKGGMTLLPTLVLGGMSEERRRHVRPFEQPAPVRTLRLMYRKTSAKRGLLDAFAEGLIGVVRREFPEIAA